MPEPGYYRQPTIHRDTIVFVSEDDLWQVPATGGKAERLTAGVGRVGAPKFSPDGTSLAFVGHEEGPSDVFTMPAGGGEVFPPHLPWWGEGLSHLDPGGPGHRVRRGDRPSLHANGRAAQGVYDQRAGRPYTATFRTKFVHCLPAE